MTALCLALATGAVLATVAVPGDAFTLAWRHSVERTAWREEYRIEAGRLRLVRASVEGSGAGVDPPPDARFADGAWAWRPNREIDALRLAHSAFGGDYRLCTAVGCRPLAALAPRPAGDGGLVLSPCGGPG